MNLRPVRNFVIALFLLPILAIGTVAALYLFVEIRTAGKRYDNIKEIPYRRVGLVLGTSPRTIRGTTNYYFKYRIDACVKLYKAGKIKKILVSGDNLAKEYNEPRYMKNALMRQGIPESDIVLDYAGLRTLDSVIRSKEVFGLEDVTIISQGFHNARAVFIALHHGIDAIGFDAKEIKHTRTYLTYGIGREALARTKMFIDLILNKQPKFLGKKIKI